MTQLPEPTSSSRRVSPSLVLAVCCLGMMVMSFSVNASALCLTAIAAEFHFDEAASGFFLSCSFWGLFFGILLCGVVADRWGARVLLLLGATLQVLGFLVVGFTHAKSLLFLGAAVCGIGSGIADALLSPLVCVLFPNARTRASNALHTFYPTGTLVLVLITLVLFAANWPWRSVFRLLAVLSVPYALAFALIPLPTQLHMGDDRLSAGRLLKSLSFFLLLGGIFLAGVTEIGPSQWLPAYIEKAAHGNRSAGTLGLLAFGATMAVGRFLSAYFIPKMNLKWFFLGGGLLAAIGLLLAAVPAPAWVSAVCLCAVGLGVAGFWPTIIACAGDVFPSAGGSMFSILAAIGNFGGVAGPLFVGLVAQHSTLRTAMAALVISPILMLLLLLVLLARKSPSSS